MRDENILWRLQPFNLRVGADKVLFLSDCTLELWEIHAYNMQMSRNYKI